MKTNCTAHSFGSAYIDGILRNRPTQYHTMDVLKRNQQSQNSMRGKRRRRMTKKRGHRAC